MAFLELAHTHALTHTHTPRPAPTDLARFKCHEAKATCRFISEDNLSFQLQIPGCSLAVPFKHEVRNAATSSSVLSRHRRCGGAEVQGVRAHSEFFSFETPRNQPDCACSKVNTIHAQLRKVEDRSNECAGEICAVWFCHGLLWLSIDLCFGLSLCSFAQIFPNNLSFVVWCEHFATPCSRLQMVHGQDSHSAFPDISEILAQMEFDQMSVNCTTTRGFLAG